MKHSRQQSSPINPEYRNRVAAKLFRSSNALIDNYKTVESTPGLPATDYSKPIAADWGSPPKKNPSEEGFAEGAVFRTPHHMIIYGIQPGHT